MAEGNDIGPSTGPLVSIVVNNFNYARFLAQCIDSAIGQTYPRLEVVVVDDASTDGSREIIRGYGEKVVTVLQAVNGGQAAAVNAGFAASRGEIVIFLDADDFLYPSAVERIVAAWRSGISKVHYRLHLVDAEGRQLDVYPASELRFDDGDVVPLLLENGFFETTVTSGNAFSRGALEAVVPVPESEYRISADAYLCSVTPFHGPVDSIESPLGAYRLHTSNAYALDNAPDGERVRRWLEYDARKYRSIQAKARAMGLPVAPDLGMGDHHHLMSRLASLRMDPERHPYERDTRMGLGWRGALACRRARVPAKRRVVFALWFVLSAILPRRAALPVVSWRLTHATRSPRVARLLRAVRRLTG